MNFLFLKSLLQMQYTQQIYSKKQNPAKTFSRFLLRYMNFKLNGSYNIKNFPSLQYSDIKRTNNLAAIFSPQKDNKRSYSPYPNRPMNVVNTQPPKANLAGSSAKNSQKFRDFAPDSNISKNILLSFDSQKNAKEKSQGETIESGSNSSTSNIYSFSNEKITDTHIRRQDQNIKNENRLSWTKYIAMEFKNEELMKNLEIQQNRVKQKAAKIQELENFLKKLDENYKNRIGELILNYEKKLSDQEATIMKKKLKIQELIEKLTDETKNCLSNEIKIYLQQTLNKYTELQNILQEQKSRAQDFAKKIEKYEKENKEYQNKIFKLETSVSKLSAQLTQANQRLVHKNGIYLDDYAYTQVIQAQTIQIDELRNTIEIMISNEVILREIKNEVANQLLACQRDSNILVRKNKSEQNNIISDLGASLTQKEHENYTLKRKMANTESKLKNAIEALKQKNLQLSAIIALPNNQLPPSTKNKINTITTKGTNLKICDQNHQEEIRKLKFQVVLLSS